MRTYQQALDRYRSRVTRPALLATCEGKLSAARGEDVVLRVAPDAGRNEVRGLRARDERRVPRAVVRRLHPLSRRA